MKNKLLNLLVVICLGSLLTSVVNVQASKNQSSLTGKLSALANTATPAILPDVSQPFSETVTTQIQTKNGAVNQHTQAVAASPNHTYNDRVVGETDPDSPNEAIYIVRLTDQPLATYQGDIADLPATSPAVTNEPKLNVLAQASVLYSNYLADKQNQFLQAAEQTLSQPLDVIYRYDVVFNGLAVKATPAEAARLLTVPGVVSVQRDYWRYPATDSSIAYLGVDGVWDGSGTGLPGVKGDGIIVGIIDSGIWPEHPSFADYGAYPPPPAKWIGTCEQPADSSAGYQCNNKLIGIQYFLDGYVASLGGEYDGLFYSGRDDNGHGTHTASTAAGNENVSAYIYGISRGQVSGVAPRAYIASYKGLGPSGGTGSDLTAAIDQAVADGVDVINYSIGSDTASDPWIDSDALAYLNARQAGVFVATSAGNDGPGASTIGSPANAPWVTSVGSSYFNRLFLSNITITMTNGGSPTTYVYSGTTTTPGVTNFDLVDARGIADTNGQTDGSCDAAFPTGTFNWNDAVLCDRGGGFLSSIHGNLIQQSGGGAVILYNTDTQYDFNSYLHPIPTVVILHSDWLSIKDLIDNNPGATFKVTFSQGTPVDSYVTPDTITGFSSRGPNINEPTGELINVLKPDLTAPGMHVLAGASPEYVEIYNGEAARYGKQNELFQVIQGTSMSSPHVAGIGALLKALHPDWTAAEIQSALMLTGLTSNQYEREAGGDSPADPFDIGSGRVLVTNAARSGFVLDESIDKYLAADPNIGGDPATLNLASLTQSDCMGTCTWTRVIRSTFSTTVSWNTVPNPSAYLTVEPASFSIASGATQMVTITANVEDIAYNNWLFGEVRFNGGGQSLHFTVAARSVAGLAPRTIEIETRRNQGIKIVEDLKSAVSGTLTITTYSGTPIETSGSVAEDPTNDFPYDNLAQIYTTTVTVPAGAKGLDVSILTSTAPDLDMYVGYDTNGNNNPDAEEELCASTTGSFEEYCSLPASGSLSSGNYWILVQNYSGSGASTDAFTLEHVVLLNDGGSGPIQVAAPASVTAGEPYDLTLSWNLPDLEAGDIRREVIGLAADGVALNEVDVTLNRLEDDVVKSAQVSSGQVIESGDVITYAITINPDPAALNYNNGSATYILTDTLPAGMTYVPGSASVTPTSVNGNQIVWEIPVQTERHYRMSTNRQNAACDTGFGGYVNLVAFGLYPKPSLSGDNIVRHVDEFFEGAIPFHFDNIDYSKLYFTDNGYLVPAEAAPTNTGVNIAIPNPAAPNNLIAGLWRDFEVVYDATNNYGISIAGTSGGNVMIVEYDNIYPKGSTIADSLDMNVIFRRQPSDADGNYEIVFAYDNVNLPDQTGSIGIENIDGTNGIAYAFNNIQNLEDLIICFDLTNIEEITYAAQVEASHNASKPLTNLLSHYVNGGGESQVEATINVVNQPPVANAGVDQTANPLDTVTLDGSLSSDPDGDLPLAFLWEQTAGTAVTLSDPTVVTPTFTSPANPSVLTFTLTVTDSLGLADPTPDTVVITVRKFFSYLPMVLRP